MAITTELLLWFCFGCDGVSGRSGCSMELWPPRERSPDCLFPRQSGLTLRLLIINFHDTSSGSDRARERRPAGHSDRTLLAQRWRVIRTQIMLWNDNGVWGNTDRFLLTTGIYSKTLYGMDNFWCSDDYLLSNKLCPSLFFIFVTSFNVILSVISN